MNKYLTQYTLNGKDLPSEIYCLPSQNPTALMRVRQLPGERITSKALPTYDNYLDTTRYYIHKGNFGDALHRLLYLMTIQGVTANTITHIQDDGLLHRLAHMVTGTQSEDIVKLIKDVDEFEETVVGTYLWAASH